MKSKRETIEIEHRLMDAQGNWKEYTVRRVVKKLGSTDHYVSFKSKGLSGATKSYASVIYNWRFKMFEFDLESLYEALIINPFTIDGSFECDMVELCEDGIVALCGYDYKIVEITSENPDEGEVKVLTDEGEILMIRFYKPASFNDL